MITAAGQASAAIEAALRRDRYIVIAGIAGIAAIAWAYIVYLDRSNSGMAMGMNMADMRVWTGADFLLMFLMWAVMMVAMMVPTAAPMVLTFASVNRKRRESRQPYVPTTVFLAGYVATWAGFAILATAGNWGLHQASLLSSMMGESTNAYLGGGLLLAAGAFQWSPLKRACLNQCRSPLGFIMTSWRDGKGGALRMGLEHGAFCLGCCWMLMGLLFVLGVMNLVWVAALAAFVLAEKVLPKAAWFTRATGVALAAWGILMVLNGVL